jgi:hypothetical protein
MHLSTNEVELEVAAYTDSQELISDDCASTIASWWISPAAEDMSLVKLAQGQQYAERDLLSVLARAADLMYQESVLNTGSEAIWNVKCLSALVDWCMETRQMMA